MFLSAEGQSREVEANWNTLLEEQEENPFLMFEEMDDK